MKHILIIFLLLYGTFSMADMSQEKIVSNYIYNFAVNTTWPEGVKNNTFEIYLLTSNKNLSSTFKNLMKEQKIHEKDIKITRSVKSVIPYSANLIYIDTNYLSEYKKVYEQIEGRPVLIVSNAYDNKRLVMINLNETKDKNVHFEINKANILNQGLLINPKVILLGGTELDVAKLYKAANDSLLQKERELEKQLGQSKYLKEEISGFKARNTALQEQFLSLNKDLTKLQDSIASLNKKSLLSQKKFESQLKEQHKILTEEKASTKKIRDDYTKANDQLDQMRLSLSAQKEKLSSQEKEVQTKEMRLSSLTQKVEKKAIEFEKLQKNLVIQDVQIADQGKVIDIQKDVLLILGLAALTFLSLVFIVFRTLRREKKITQALKDTKIALEEQVKMTEKANASKTKFLAHMSHELRTPLNAVLGYSQLLQKDPNMSQDNQKILSTINRSGEHLLALINDVLEVSKIETGEISLDPIAFDFYQFLDDIYTMFEFRVKNEGLHLELIKDKGLPQFIYADINKIRQIFINIIGNAIKFTVEGGITIRVGHNLNDSTILVEFEDTGAGIDAKEIDKLFEPFKQTISGKLGGGGAGLGLSIVLEYVELMGGKIDAQSKLAFGTIFYLTLPFEKVERSAVEMSKKEVVKSLKEEDMGIEVLIADDNKTNNDLLSKTLSRIGFNVTTVENGFEALRLFKKMRYRIVLLDLEMPIMNGYQAVKEIRALAYGKETPILAITASVFGIDQKKAYASGFNALIRKPFKDYEVFEEMRKSLKIEYIYEEEITDSGAGKG